jgi:hypothetical protein
MTQKDKMDLQSEVNKIFNETVKYMQFRFQEMANSIAALPVTDETTKKEDKLPV